MRQLGRYRLLEELGSGGFAVVYKAEIAGPEGFKSRVAIKRIHPFITHNQPGFVNSLTNEARLSARFEHPNVVHVTELDSQPDDEGDLQYFMVMELVDGVTLDVLMRMVTKRGEKLPPNVTVDLLLQIARGLTYVHALKDEDGRDLKMVHRDLKPSNILISREGVAKIFDFGIAKAINSSGPRTATGVTRGTAAFMSPEQAYGRPVNFACDVFAFGAIIFELAVGEQLIVGDSMAAQLMTVVNTPAKFRRDEVDEAVPGLGRIFERCRQPRPRDRFPSTNALIDDLRKLRRELDSDVDPPAYIVELYNDPRALVSREELAEYKVLQWEKVPSTATFFELPGYRRSSDGKIVPSAASAHSWGVAIAPPDAPTIESAVLDEPDDIELDSDTMAEYEAVKAKRLSPLWLLLLIPPFLLLMIITSGVAFRLLLGLGDGAAEHPRPDAEEAVTVGQTAADETADVGPDEDAQDAAASDEAVAGEPAVDDALPGADAVPPADVGTVPDEPVTADPVVEDADPGQPAEITPAPVADAQPDGETGTLKINAYPSATVFIDGQEAGSTFVTVRGVSLPPGPHRIRMVRTNDGFEQTLDVSILSGETLAVPFHWADEGTPAEPEVEQSPVEDPEQPPGETEEAP